MLQFNKYTAIVEIFKPDTSQWYRTCALPTDNFAITLQLVAIGDKIYTLGGSELDQMFVASVDDLLCCAVPATANQTLAETLV